MTNKEHGHTTTRRGLLGVATVGLGATIGGVVAAPAFRDIARFALQYLDVPPDDLTSLRRTDGAPPR